MRTKGLAKLLSLIAAFATLGIGMNATSKARMVREIPKGDPLRKTLLDQIRPLAIDYVGSPVEFTVDQIRTNGTMAFVAVNAQRPGGIKIDPLKTPFALKQGETALEFWDCCHMEAVFMRENGRWKVAEAHLGSTDVWWESWCDRAPKGLIDECKNKP